MLGKRNHRASLSREALKIRVHFGCAENTETTCSEVGDPEPATLGGRTNTQRAQTPLPSLRSLWEGASSSCQTQLCPRADQLNQPLRESLPSYFQA